MSGAHNMFVNLGSLVSAVAFGYIAEVSGSYDRPLFLMALVLGSGALLWFNIDPTRQLIPEPQLDPATVSHVNLPARRTSSI